MTESRGRSGPDPLGKRALFWVPTSAGTESSQPRALPVGKRALFSGAKPQDDDDVLASDNPLAARGSFVVECERCHQSTHVGVLDLLLYQLPFGVWLPRGRFDRRMTCPACRKRAWCSVSLRR